MLLKERITFNFSPPFCKKQQESRHKREFTPYHIIREKDINKLPKSQASATQNISSRTSSTLKLRTSN